jgi:hypothetical protein
VSTWNAWGEEFRFAFGLEGLSGLFPRDMYGSMVGQGLVDPRVEQVLDIAYRLSAVELL